MTDGPSARVECQPDCECKVGRLIAKYDIEGMNDELRDRWVGENREAESVRDLSDRFNRAVLRRAATEAGHSVNDMTIETLYRHLVKDVSKGLAAEARREVAQYGLDDDEVVADFVSHQTIYRHLVDCLGVSKDGASPSPEREIQRLNRLQSRCEAVVNDSVARLHNANELRNGGFRPSVSFRLICEECGAVAEFTEVVKNGGCRCG